MIVKVQRMVQKIGVGSKTVYEIDPRCCVLQPVKGCTARCSLVKIKTKKLVLMQKQMISISERCAEHQFAGRNTQHPGPLPPFNNLLFVSRWFVSWTVVAPSVPHWRGCLAEAGTVT